MGTLFDSLFVIVSGVTKGQRVAANEAKELPYLRVANVQRGHHYLSVVKTITVRKSDAQRYALRVGDILMTAGATGTSLGVLRSGVTRSLTASTRIMSSASDHRQLTFCPNG
jgi:hypothetical protein